MRTESRPTANNDDLPTSAHETSQRSRAGVDGKEQKDSPFAPRGRRPAHAPAGQGPTDAIDGNPPSSDRSAPRLSSKDLFGSGTRISIAHGDQIYVLQITRHGKLILTK